MKTATPPVLVADDNPVNQKLISRLLSAKGHSATVVGDGRQAVDALKAERFDVVLMDVQMPVMGGLEAVPRRRAAMGSEQADPGEAGAVETKDALFR